MLSPSPLLVATSNWQWQTGNGKWQTKTGLKPNNVPRRANFRVARLSILSPNLAKLAKSGPPSAKVSISLSTPICCSIILYVVWQATAGMLLSVEPFLLNNKPQLWVVTTEPDQFFTTIFTFSSSLKWKLCNQKEKKQNEKAGHKSGKMTRQSHATSDFGWELSLLASVVKRITICVMAMFQSDNQVLQCRKRC